MKFAISESQTSRAMGFFVLSLFLSLYSSRTGVAVASSLCLGAGAYLYWREISEAWKRIPQFVPLVAFLTAIGLSILFADTYPWSTPAGKVRYWFLYIPLLFAFASVPKRIETIQRLGVYVAIALGSVSVIQYFGWWIWFEMFIPRPTPNLIYPERFHARGFLVHHTIFSSVLLFLFHLMFASLLAELRVRTLNYRYAIGVAFSAAAILATYSRGAWFAWISSSVLVAAIALGRRSIKWIVGLCILISVLLLVSLPFRTRFTQLGRQDNAERIALWNVSIRMFQESPIVGKGFHSFASHLDRLLPETEKRAFPHMPRETHNFYLDLLGGTGVLGVVTFLWLVFSTLFSYFKILKRDLRIMEVAAVLSGLGSLLAALVNNLTDSHLMGSFGLCGAVLFLALGQSIVFNRDPCPVGSVDSLQKANSQRTRRQKSD